MILNWLKKFFARFHHYFDIDAEVVYAVDKHIGELTRTVQCMLADLAGS